MAEQELNAVVTLRNVVLIATGSGLAPFVSMLSTHLRFPGRVRRVMSRTCERVGSSRRHGAPARGRKIPMCSCAAARR